MSDELKREIADKLSRLRLLSPEDMADQLLPLFSSVIVASFEEAVQLVKRWNFMCCSDADGLSADIRALVPAKVRLRAEIRELERVDAEAKWWRWLSRMHDESYFAVEGDKHLAAISQELAKKRAAYDKVKGGDVL